MLYDYSLYCSHINQTTVLNLRRLKNKVVMNCFNKYLVNFNKYLYAKVEVYSWYKLIFFYITDTKPSLIES